MARAPLSAPADAEKSGDRNRNGRDDNAKLHQRGNRELAVSEEAQATFANAFYITALTGDKMTGKNGMCRGLGQSLLAKAGAERSVVGRCRCRFIPSIRF
jgi:hypothetical protein